MDGRFRLITGMMLATAWLIPGSAFSPAAHAEVAMCYDDPAVVLSNGTTLDLSDTIATDAMNVQQVSYTIHAPDGIRVQGVVATAGPLGPKETFTFTSTGANGQYQISSIVFVQDSSTPVTASAAAVTVVRVSGASVSGSANQKLQLSLPA